MALPEKKKEGGALLAMAFKPKAASAPAPGVEPEPEAEATGGEAFALVADALGIPPEKRASAEAALKAYVHECMGESDTGEGY